jgi:hypothetical protein
LFFTLLDYPADLKFFNTIEKMSLNLHLRSERKNLPICLTTHSR